MVIHAASQLKKHFGWALSLPVVGLSVASDAHAWLTRFFASLQAFLKSTAIAVDADVPAIIDAILHDKMAWEAAYGLVSGRIAAKNFANVLVEEIPNVVLLALPPTSEAALVARTLTLVVHLLKPEA